MSDNNNYILSTINIESVYCAGRNSRLVVDEDDEIVTSEVDPSTANKDLDLIYYGFHHFVTRINPLRHALLITSSTDNNRHLCILNRAVTLSRSYNSMLII